MENVTELSNEFGPFTPQELEKVVDWLKSKNLRFEIGKDQQVEDNFRSNDSSNVLNRARWRTEVYLAQVFMVQVADMKNDQVAELSQLLAPNEKIPQRFLNKAVDDSELRMKKQQSKKIIWAWIAIIFMGGPMIFSILKILFKGE